MTASLFSSPSRFSFLHDPLPTYLSPLQLHPSFKEQDVSLFASADATDCHLSDFPLPMVFLILRVQTRQSASYL